MRKLLAATLLAVTLFCPGCFRILVPVSATWPRIHLPKRPHIDIPEDVDPDDPKTAPFLKATYQYSRHIDVLEKTVDAYNKEAEEHNAKVERELFGD
jgi:hypothetical protein